MFSGCTHSKDGGFSGCIHSLKGQGVFRLYSLSQRTGCFQGILTLLKDRVFQGALTLKGQGVFRVYSLSQRTGCFQGVLTLLKDCGVLAAKC